jgi:hypothetical protein
MTLTSHSTDARAKAEAKFRKQEHQASEGAKARAEYDAAQRALADKTARLKALRLAKEEADRQSSVAKKTRQRESG